MKYLAFLFYECEKSIMGLSELEVNFDDGTHGHVGGPGHVFSVQHVCH